nr:hypothetical protein [Escherichia coli]
MDEQIQGILNLINQDPIGWAILSRGNAHLDQLESLIEQPVLRYGGKSFWDEKGDKRCIAFDGILPTFQRCPVNEEGAGAFR